MPRALLLVLFASLIHAQSSLNFEVASIRPSGPKSIGGDRSNAGQISRGKINMDLLLRWAYNVEEFQVEGPAWIRSTSDTYDLQAKRRAGTTPVEERVMLQHLLAERFHLALHYVSREFPTYDLMIAKGGAKFRESIIDPSKPEPSWVPPSWAPKLGADRFPEITPGMPWLSVWCWRWANDCAMSTDVNDYLLVAPRRRPAYYR